ncbi:MAG: OadG family protein [Clostridiaceae bacterium]|nr:OadG family protein [Clostridiaceae bacterium]
MTNFSDTFAYTMIVTLFGMGIVFIVLVLLQYILKLMKVVFYKEEKKDSGVILVTETKTAEPEVPMANETEDADEADQLSAVITAAVISCLGRNSSFAVRSIRRIEDPVPAWGKAGRTEQMANRF